MEPMLKPGEIRKATRTDGWTVEVGSVAGGSFTQVVVRDTLGIRAWSRNFQFETDALQYYADAVAG